MRQIFKNYLATFIKNWLQTIGTILFILMMFAVVIGFLAAPLQIYGSIQSMNGKNHHYNQMISENNYKYNAQFLYKFLYQNDDSYTENMTDKNGNQTGKTGEILHNAGLTDKTGSSVANKKILSDIYKMSLDNEVSDAVKGLNKNDMYDAYASDLSSGISAFRSGSLVKLGVGFDLTQNDGTPVENATTAAYESNIVGLAYNLLNSQADASKEGETPASIQSRMVAIVNNLFSASSFSATATDLVDELQGANIANLGKAVVRVMASDMAKRGKTSQKVYLLSSQMFNGPRWIGNNEDGHISGDSFLSLMSRPEYSYDFLNYVTTAALNDLDNPYAFNKETQTFNYDYSIEKSMYISKTDSSSLFPTLSMELRTDDSQDGPNQIQLEEGRLPQKIDDSYANKQDTLEQVMDGTLVPEIVINSGYAANNHLHVGDYITLPDAVQHNHVTTQGTMGLDNSDDTLTSAMKYRISGIGEKFDDTVPGEHYTPFMQNIDTYANAYVDNGWFNLLKEAMWNNSSSWNGYFESVARITNKKGVKPAPVNVFNFEYTDKNKNNGLYDQSVIPFVDYSNTTTMSSVNNTKIRVIIFIILGIAVLILAFIFINFIITKELNETRRQIGIFKSFGYKISELSWIFAIKTFLTIFVGAVLGWVVSIAIQTWSAGNYTSSVMFKFHTVYAGAAFMVIIFLVIPIIFLAVSYIMTLFYLKEPTLSLLSNGAKVKKGKIHNSLLIKHLAKQGKGFGYRLQQGFVKDSIGKFIVVQILFAIASLTFTLLFGAQGLMYSVADQGFSVLQKGANHRYAWANQETFGIGYDAKAQGDEQGPRYSFSKTALDDYKNTNFKYVPYSGNDKIGNVLNKDSTMSDSRYRENYLISSISNTFDVNKDEAWEMLMPLDYFLVDRAGVKPADLPTTVDSLINSGQVKDVKDNTTGKSLLREAADQDAKMPSALANTEMSFHDNFLNWILSFRIAIMPNETSGDIEGMNQIKSDLINGKNNFNLETLIKYVAAHDKVNPKDKIKIDMNAMGDTSNTGQQALLRKEFGDTLFGLSDTVTNQDDKENFGKKNNLFLSDITKIITLELSESYFENIFNGQLDKATPTNVNGNKKTYSVIDTVSALDVSHASSVWNDFSPNNKKYWGMQDNPLMTSMLSGAGSSSDSSSSKSDSGSGGLSLSKMNAQTVSLIMAASMLSLKSNDLQEAPTITINEAFFNKETEALFENIPVTGVDDSQMGRNSITLFDYRDNKYGTYDHSLTHEGVSDATYAKLATDTGNKNSVYAVVPYGLAKYRNLHVGSKFEVSTDTKQKRTITLDVIGINKSVAFSLGGGWSIDADYNQFSNKFFDSTLQNLVDDKGQDLPLFNSWISNEPMLEGDINLNDISSSVDKMKFVGKNLSMAIKPGSSVFGSIFNGMVDFSTLLGSKVDPNYRLITNPNIAGTSTLSSVLPFNILRAGVNQGISDINNILIVFMVLVAVMLLIILVVVMNIIVEQATPIILTLKSLGYNQKEINWITMGSYVTGAIISFIVAYCVSLAVWNIFLAVAGSLWHIYVFMSYTWEAPVITFLVVGAILFIGWFVSDRKVERIPLTLVTGFN